MFLKMAPAWQGAKVLEYQADFELSQHSQASMQRRIKWEVIFARTLNDGHCTSFFVCKNNCLLLLLYYSRKDLSTIKCAFFMLSSLISVTFYRGGYYLSLAREMQGGIPVRPPRRRR